MFYIQDFSFPRGHSIIKPLHSQFWGQFKSFSFSCAFFLYLTLKDWRAGVKYQQSSPKCSFILQYHQNHLHFQKNTLLHKYRQFKRLYQTNDKICKLRDVQPKSVLRMHLTPSVTYLTMLPHFFFIIFLHTNLLHSEFVAPTGLNMVITNKKLKNILQGQTASQRLSDWSNRD